MKHLNRIQRRILALLEEAGEENIASLINTVAVPKGTAPEIDAFSSGLLSLLEENYLVIACGRDPKTLRLVPIAEAEGHALVRDLKRLIHWSAAEGRWDWCGRGSIAEVQLTDSGEAAAREILLQDGWPEKPLDSYGSST